MIDLNFSHRKKTMAKNLAKLTPAEDKVWSDAFEFYVNAGKTDRMADKYAWRDVCEQFPRLKKFDGCKP